MCIAMRLLHLLVDVDTRSRSPATSNEFRHESHLLLSPLIEWMRRALVRIARDG